MAIDRITRSYLEDFQQVNFQQSIPQETLFEHFVNYSIIEPFVENRYYLEDLNIGENGTIGIDGFALIVNKKIFTESTELEDYFSENANCDAECIFIQAKTGNSFHRTEVGGFGTSVKDFVSESPCYRWSQKAKKGIDLFSTLLKFSRKLTDRPICKLFFVCLGNFYHDQNLVAEKDVICKLLDNENIFSRITFEYVDTTSIQLRYKRLSTLIEKTFEFPNRITLPIIKNVKAAYLGVIPLTTVVDLMTDDYGNLLSNVFYDNVRDFQGESNRVNTEIAKTLESEIKDAFVVMNNGITIVAEEDSQSRDAFTIRNYQIINGCQTSHVIYNTNALLNNEIKITLKLIITNNSDLQSKIIRSTNSQTEVKEQDLLAFTSFQKKLEDYFKTFDGDSRLYYERRSKQYSGKNIERYRIIDKTALIKVIASIYFDKPEMATRYFGTLYKTFGTRLFIDNHSFFPYYVAAFSLYKIDSLFRNGLIDKKFRKIKFYFLMMLRHEIENKKIPTFRSKDIDKISSNILKVFTDDSILIEKIAIVTDKLNDIHDNDPVISFDDNELSKSKVFLNKCLTYY